jgi:hypothetical protein
MNSSVVKSWGEEHADSDKYDAENLICTLLLSVFRVIQGEGEYCLVVVNRNESLTQCWFRSISLVSIRPVYFLGIFDENV